MDEVQVDGVGGIGRDFPDLRRVQSRADVFYALGVEELAVYGGHPAASALTRTQVLASFLSVLYAAVERYRSPEALVTDGGGIFRARQARAVYEVLGIRKKEIERGRPWQSYIETHFNVQRRMADHRFAGAESWAELAEAHDRFVEDYNAQAHWAHRERADGRRSPSEVLGFLSGVRHREEELRRAPSSPAASRAPWTPSGMPGSGTGDCTARRRWRAGSRRCGSRPRA